MTGRRRLVQTNADYITRKSNSFTDDVVCTVCVVGLVASTDGYGLTKFPSCTLGGVPHALLRALRSVVLLLYVHWNDRGSGIGPGIGELLIKPLC